MPVSTFSEKMKPKVVVQIIIDDANNLSFQSNSTNLITTCGMVIFGLITHIMKQAKEQEASNIIIPDRI